MMPVDRTKVRRRPVSSVGPSTSSSMFSRKDGQGILSLHGKDFVLDVENVKMRQQLTDEIEKLGGRVVDEISEEKKPFCLVSDSQMMGRIEKYKPEQITPAIMRSLPMLVREAIHLKVRYRSCQAFLESVNKLKVKIKAQKKVMMAPAKKPGPSSSSNQGGMTQLQPPYLKLEDNRGAFAPLYKQFPPNQPSKIYLGKHMGKSLFHKNHKPDETRPEKSPNEKMRLAMMPKGGYCEICSKKFESGKEHFASREHVHHISQPGLWNSVDKLCGSFLDYVSSSNPRTRRHRPSPPSPSDYHR
ncbi:hypothetical protein PENTCL1PPCAC_10608 [Pristionchus entomophagus]|uniref:DBF4-type domain-containing protein n=1 Tax=Pristionchus entomophagus TaxID=358040 RepID=A0AAV5T2L2_9BILA|nr:hypothetical protein PENTCL1PPCAC_10608 [Pristionchus entomophagus]